MTRVLQYKSKIFIFITCINLSLDSFLYKIKVVDTELCALCNIHTESLTHLFWECIYVDQLWCSIMNWINITLYIHVDVS